MKRVSFLKKAMMYMLAAILGFGPCISSFGTLEVQAATTVGSASYATGTQADKSEAVGTWSYWVDGVEIKNNNADLMNKLPYEGSSYRYTTTNYDNNNGAFDTSNWATSFMWDLNGNNPYSSTVYAIPLAFRASVYGGAKNVIQVTAPSRLSDTANNVYTMQMPSDGTLTDFMIQTSFDVSSAKVDAITDWTYDIVMENSADTSEYLKLTMVQGSVFAYFELVNDDTLTILRNRTLPAAVAYLSDAGDTIVIRCMDNMNNDYDYYAFYGAPGTTFTAHTSGNLVTSIDVAFTGNKYMSMAYLGSTPTSPDDSWGTSMCQAYLPYAFNYVTDTKATYSYNAETSTLTTTYTYTVENKNGQSNANGTIMGVLPHQYKNIKEGTQFLDYTYETVRGTMKTMAGTSFVTELKYSGIIPFMPDYSDDSAEEQVISDYLTDYTDNFSSDYFENYEGNGDTYWDGKGLNRLANAMAAAEAAGDVALAKSMYESLKGRLEEWFTYSGSSDSTYFYYDSDIGSMFGFPQSYDSVNQMNDHHFHYGYFIYAAAQVALRDKAGTYGTDGTWADRYGGLVNELIKDIACPTRNSGSSAYPYLRNFAPYEGHSWASGHANFDMGNNQESSSEALNAWAGIILWGEVTGGTIDSKSIRDLGIYLYATEISAVQNYWYDVDEDVLSDAYRYKVGANDIDTIDKTTDKVQNNSAAIVWGGSYTYATWFSANPLYIQGINLLPMNPTCFYLAGDADYIQQNWDLAYEKASAAGWDMESWVDIWCQYYAMAFPEAALAQWKSVEEGTDSYGVEGGDTKAHTYHFIKSLCTYGTPHTSITSNATLSSVFVKDGVKTYVAYNAGTSEQIVTFSDGYQITVPANSMKVEKEGEATNLTQYTIEYYLENTSDEFVLDATQVKYGVNGTEVSVEAKDMAGYIYDTSKGNVLSATVKEDGSTVLKLYYKRAEYNITYELNGIFGDLDKLENDSSNPATYKYKDTVVLKDPTYYYYTFDGWYKDEALTMKVTSIQETDMGDITLYASWKDPYEYYLDANKKLTYQDGIITIEVSGVSSDGKVDILAKICEADQVDNIVAGGASALTGYSATYDEETQTWKLQFDESDGAVTGKYIVFRTNVIVSNGAELSGAGVYEIPEKYPYETIAYTENFYQENLDGQFVLVETANKRGKLDSTVSCTEKTYTGFVYDDDNANNVQSATLSKDTTTVLARYYEREEYDITYNLNGGEAKDNPDYYTYGQTITLNAPTRTGYTFVGWYTDEACTSTFTGIKATSTGDITLYAKWVKEGAEKVTYYVEHYKQSEEDASVYTEDTEAKETLTGYAGTTVYATAKTYDGYTENTTHASRVASGLIPESGTLTLKLYYDLVIKEDNSDTFGVTYDASTGKATFYYNGVTGGTVYYAVYDDLATAQGYADAANLEENYPGFGKVPGHSGYPMTSDTSGAQYQVSIAEGKYIVYAFNPENGGVEDWYVAVTSAIDLNNSASYTVNHFKQVEVDSDNYTLAETETLQGEIGATVTATPKNYVGYTVYTEHASYKASGTVVAGETSLELSIYYNKNASDDDSYATPESGGFTYDASTQVATFYYEGVTNGIVYIATYDDLATASSIMEAANSGGGFAAVTGHGGYMLTADGDRATVDYSVASGKYMVYAFNPGFAGVEAWYVGVASETQSGGEDPDPVEVAYTVKHYQQNASQNGYELKDTENLTGYAGDVVTATAKTYTGFTYKAGADGEVLSGTLAEGETLELSLYYTRNTYGITYNNLENATNAAGNMATYVYGVGLTLEDPTYKDDSHTFAGWYEDAACTATPISVIAADRTGDVTVYAKWEEADNTVSYTVEYYQQNKTQNGYDLIHSDVLSGEAGDTVTATINTYTGFTHNEQAEGTLLSGTLAKDTTLVLKVYYDRNTYNITYNNLENATNAAGNAATYVYGVGLTLQAPAYQDDSFTFGGWYEDAACTATPISVVAEDRTGDVTVYAKWIAADNSVSYTVEYYQQNTAQTGYDKVSSTTLSGEAGDVVTATINTYTGFTHNEQAEGTLLSGTLAKDTTLVLKVYYDRNTYNITYENMDDATNAEANKATYVYGVGLTLQAPSKEGYTFDGWFKDADFINPISVIGTDSAADVTVYAKWTIIITEADYVVKYYLETTTPGSYVEVIADRVEGTDTVGKLIEAAEKEYEGYELNEEAEGSLLSGNLVANEVLTLKLFYDRCTYTIIYNNMEDATNPEENAATYTYGEGFTLSDPVRENYVFAGWYLDEACTAENKVTKITDLQTGDVVLYAKWVKEHATYTIRFYQQNKELTGYDEVTADSIIASNEIGTVVDAIAYGYGKDYTGFVLNEEYAESVISGTVSKATPLTLKLYYDRATYNITYVNMEDATNAEGNQATYIYGIGLTLQTPVKEGWIFAGWYLDSAFSEDLKVATIGSNFAEDVTVYAKWIEQSKAAEYTVYYYLQDVNLKDYTEVEADRFIGSGEVGVEALAPVKDYEGFELNIEADGYKESGKVLEDGSLALKLYYARCNYNIIYHNMEDAVNPDTNTAAYVYGIGLALANPSRGGYVFEGWYTNEGMAEEDKIVEIGTAQTGDVNLYAKWTEYVPDEEVELEPDQSFTVDEIQDQYYTGSKIVPSVVVKDGDVILTEKKDYTLKFTNNVKAGTATVKITGKGNYNGYVEKTFTIKSVDIGIDEMTADDIFVAVNKSGKAIAVKPKLVWGKKTLKMNTDYRIDPSIPGNATSYSQPGTYTVTLQGIANFTGRRTLEFTIAKKETVLMSKVKVGKIPNQYYRNGAIIKPELNVSYKNEPLVEGVDYEAEYINNTQAGTATVILTGIGDTYVGEKKVTFKIVGTALGKMGLSLARTEFEYTGDSIYPKYFSGDLMAGKDFTVTYSNNKKVGKGTVTFTGIGAYSGTVKKTFKILPYNIANNVEGYFEDTTGDITVEYVKAGCTPKVEVRFKGAVLKEGTDYTLKYTKNKAVSTATLKATILVTGKGTYKGTYKKDFTITKGDLSNVLIIPTDIAEKSGQKATYYMAKVTLTDASGKKLSAGTDYDKTMSFEYKNANGEWIAFDKNSTIGDLKAGTKLRVTVTERTDGKGNFTGSVTAEYQMIPSTGNLKSVKVKVYDQTYTGQAVKLSAEDFQYVTLNGTDLTYGTDYEIVEGSYVNNIKKGTAKVTIRGIGKNYGGTKVVSFKIGARSLKDIIAGIFKK